MPLLKPAELGVGLPTLTRAEALVAADLGGTDLSERTLTQTGTFQGGVIPLKDGPATEVLSFSLNGYPMQPSLFPWHVDMGLGHILPNPLMGGYGAGVYAIVYKAGWTPDNVPSAVKEAVLMTAKAIEAGEKLPAGIVSRQIGDVRVQYAQGGGATLTPDALALLAPYRRLRF